MLSIKQFRYSSDNLAYLIHGKNDAIAIDGGATEEILSYLSDSGLTLILITNTHDHPDHIPGNRHLHEKTGAALLSPMDAAAGKEILLENHPIKVLHTPGHTMDSVTFHTDDRIITGDTLFNGTIGNCFSGDLKAFYESIKKLMALPDATVVYPGHDYAEYAMAFARVIEPNNPAFDDFLKSRNLETVCSTLSEEKRVNPYLRFNDPKMIRILEDRQLPVNTEFERWESIMSLG